MGLHLFHTPTHRNMKERKKRKREEGRGKREERVAPGEGKGGCPQRHCVVVTLESIVCRCPIAVLPSIKLVHFNFSRFPSSLPSLSVEDVTSSAVTAAAARIARAPSVALIAFAPFVAIVVRPLSAMLLSYELLLRRSRRCFFSPRRRFDGYTAEKSEKMDEDIKIIEDLRQSNDYLRARQDATHVIANLQRQRINSQIIASQYLEKNLDLVDMLINGYEQDGDIALTYGAVARECIRHQCVARHVLGSDHMKKFFDYIQLPNFEIASDALSTFKELLTRHKSTVSEFLSKNYDWFFEEYNTRLLESNSYFTRRLAIKLLADMLLDRSNSATMVRYVAEYYSPRAKERWCLSLYNNVGHHALGVFP
ncbi:uncharacterized protein LOC107460550 [Arachis duranensis]|uniref:Uncharacterized protein LOC107460550 n=1 Tax=Arachis duranensis TaxID=130453 RepID=A0A9C6WLR3_ARADU|nr:uncharacterized protein LOC107460550 [Arachis duranensis]